MDPRTPPGFASGQRVIQQEHKLLFRGVFPYKVACNTVVLEV